MLKTKINIHFKKYILSLQNAFKQEYDTWKMMNSVNPKL